MPLAIKHDNDIVSIQWEKRNHLFWKAYLIHEMTATGACRANKGTIKDFWMAVPLENINTLKKNLKIYQKFIRGHHPIDSINKGKWLRCTYFHINAQLHDHNFIAVYFSQAKREAANKEHVFTSCLYNLDIPAIHLDSVFKTKAHSRTHITWSTCKVSSGAL